MVPLPAPAVLRSRRPHCRLALTALFFATAALAGAQGGFDAGAPPDLGNYDRAFQRVPIFFPPNPPPLGRALLRGAPPAGRFAAPAELALYVNELFYPALATRLYSKTLSAKLRTQLNDYRATKVRLQQELRTELERGRTLEPDARTAALAAFAKRQTPQLVALEQTAERLRKEFIVGNSTWSAFREWHLGDNPVRGYSPLEIAQVMRSYAFYQNGLLPAQRRLLREISLELQMAADSADKAAAAQPHLFFPPEPARVLIPDTAPPAVAVKFAAYQTKKSRLKKELYDAVYRHDGERFPLFNSTLKNLATRQAPELAELDRLAEEIRTGLAALPEPPQMTERSPLPPVLNARVSALLTQLTQAQRDARDKLEAILAQTPAVRANYRFETDGLRYVVIPSRGFSRGGKPPDPQALQAARAQFAAVAEEYGRQLADLINEKDAIAAEAGKLLRTTKPDAINAALTTAIRVSNAKETETEYRDYRVAVFQPGLSPEQRRLLFDGVVEQLALPLPRGELQPMRRENSW